jgi:hypothetical protein
MTPEEEQICDEYLMDIFDAEFDAWVATYDELEFTYDELEFTYDELKAKCNSILEMIDECEKWGLKYRLSFVKS